MCELAVSVDDWAELRRLARKSTTVSRPRGTCLRLLVVTCSPNYFVWRRLSTSRRSG